MTKYTEEDLAVFKEASAELAQIVTLTKLVDTVPQNLCAEMDGIFRRVYLRRANRLMADCVAEEVKKKPSLKRKLTLKDLAPGKVPE